jgi:phosphoribosylformylglycinamidine synthase
VTATPSPAVAILHAPGTNRDGEAARAVALAGGCPEIVPVGRPLGPYRAVIVPGGFSYGDALGAGLRMAWEAGAAVADFAASGRPVLGICNGFQVLVRAGLLPGGGEPSGPRNAGLDPVSLVHNARGRFECRWVHLAVEAGNRAGLADVLPRVISCPVAHGEGRLVGHSEETAASLAAGGRVLFRYVHPDGRPACGAYPANPNGSLADIAGLCNEAGNVWGLMPHPEDHVDAASDPDPTLGPGRLGLSLFSALVQRARAD